MKEKIISISSGEQYYILEELNYQDKKYVLGAQCDVEKEQIEEQELVLFNVDIKSEDLVINNVNDQQLAEIVTGKILDKIKNS